MQALCVLKMPKVRMREWEEIENTAFSVLNSFLQTNPNRRGSNNKVIDGERPPINPLLLQLIKYSSIQNRTEGSRLELSFLTVLDGPAHKIEADSWLGKNFSFLKGSSLL